MFANHFNTQEYSDLLIVLEPETCFHAHRQLLTLASPFFMSLLDQRWNKRSPKITLTENPVAFKHWLQAVYCNEICKQLDVSTLIEVAKLSHQYMTPQITSMTN